MIRTLIAIALLTPSILAGPAYAKWKKKTAADALGAAILLAQGDTPEDDLQAYKFAVRASELDPANPRAKSLAAELHDRYLCSLGKPQIYGTQFCRVDGVWRLKPIDVSAVTDQDRAKWGLPPLAELKRRVDAMNKKE